MYGNNKTLLEFVYLVTELAVQICRSVCHVVCVGDGAGARRHFPGQLCECDGEQHVSDGSLPTA